MRHHLLLLPACLVVVVAVAGCGGGSSDEDQIKDVGADFATAFENQDWEEACELLSAKAQAQIEIAGAFFDSKGCADTVQKFAALSDEDFNYDDARNVTDIKISGDNATARAGGETTNFVKEDGDWKIDADPDEEDTSTSSSSSSEESSEPAQAPELTVAEQGFTNTDSGATYGLIIENPSTDADALEVEVTVNLIGAGGDIVQTATANLIGVPAGDEFAVGGEADTSGDRVRRMDVTVTASEGRPTGELILPEATRPKIITDEFGGFTVRVQVQNTLDTPLSSITDVFAVLRDNNGKIIGGVSGFPDNDIPPGGRAAVELFSFASLSNASTADASADGETSP